MAEADACLTLVSVFRSGTAHDAKDFARVFLLVHAALAHGRLEERDWELLDANLPVAQRWWSWDRCERLRRGTVEYLYATGGDFKDVFATADARTISFITKSCLLTPHGRAVLARSIDGHHPH